MRTIAIVNLKGGVGKTIAAINIATILATEHGQRVLLIDADGQGNATKNLLPAEEYTGLSALLQGEVICYDEVIVPSSIRNLDVIPADSALWRSDLAEITGERLCLSALRDLRDNVSEDDAYDIILIDCPPSFSAACRAALMASGSIIIPVLPDAFSAAGMEELIEQMDGVLTIQPNMHISGILINQWHNADVVHGAVEYLREAAPVPVFETIIRRTDKVLESTWACQPLQVWSPRSSAAQDYRKFVQEFVQKEGIIRGQ